MSHQNACSAIHPKTTAWTPGKEDCSHKKCGSHDFRLWSPQSYSFCKYQAFVFKKKKNNKSFIYRYRTIQTDAVLLSWLSLAENWLQQLRYMLTPPQFFTPMISELIQWKPFRITLAKPNYFYSTERKTKKMQNEVNAIQKIQ